MTLQELRVSSYLYLRFTNDDKHYKLIANETLDVMSDDDCNKLLKFLNDWGCRQFKKENHEEAKVALRKWYESNEQYLPPHGRSLIDFSEKKITYFSEMFDSLKRSFASTTILGYKKSFGVVGAAKTLFALRKDVFPPWDNPIIEHFKFRKSGSGYIKYMLQVQREIISFKQYCRQNEVNFEDILSILNRPLASMAKLIDEYYWMNYTKECIPSILIKYGKLSHQSTESIE